MENILYVRASSRPRFNLCPSSELKDGPLVDYPNHNQAEGNAFAAAMDAVIKSTEPDLARIAAHYEVSMDALAVKVLDATALWEDRIRNIVAEYLPGGVTLIESEHAAKTDWTGGTMDVVIWGIDAQGRTACVIIDWKWTGVKRDYSAQLISYAAALKVGAPVLCVTAYPVLKHLDKFEATPKEVLAARDAHIERTKNVGKRYAPGAACEYCPRRMSCQARKDFLATSSAALTGVSGELSYDHLIELYPKAKMLKKALKLYDDQLKEAVKVYGSIGLDDGMELAAVTQSKREIDIKKAWGVLAMEFGFGSEDMQQCMSLSISKAEDALKAKQPRGKGAAAVRDLKAALDKAGAVTKVPYTTVKERKARK